MSLLQNSNAVTPVSGYNIDYSCRFNAGDPGYLQKNFSSGSPGTTWTWSCWIKRSKLGATQQPFDCYIDGSNRHHLAFNADDTFNTYLLYSGSTTVALRTTRLYRDPSAWYHIVVVWDTTNVTSTERVRFYTNGVRDTVNIVESSAYPAQNDLSPMTDDVQHAISVYSGNFSSSPSGWYLAEMNFIDGTAVAPSSFAEADEDTNEWKAIRYGGSYGTAGFYLKFEDAADLGNDSSGNGNDWTVGNLVATDQMIDTPQNSTGGNFATWNPLCYAGGYLQYSEGNLKITGGSAASSGNTPCTFTPPSTGKWYWELECVTTYSDWPFIGTVDSTVYEVVATWSANDGRPGESESNGGWKIGSTGNYETDGGGESAGGQAYVNGNIIQFALDHDNGALYYGVNNVWYTPTANTAVPTSGASRTGAVMTWTAGARSFIPAIQQYDTSFMTGNFGQDSSFAGSKTAQGNKDGNNNGDFYYTPPAGYLALCSDNLPDPAIALPGEHFDTLLWTGDGTAGAKTISGLSFQPDFFFQGARAGGGGGAHLTYDAVRGFGSTKELTTDSDKIEGGENADEYGFVSDVTSDGVTYGQGSLGVSSGIVYYNKNNAGYASWLWKAGGTPTADNVASPGNTPTAGSVKINGADLESGLAGTTAAKRISANTTNGFSIVSYVGTGGTATVGHGLAVAPSLVAIKRLDTTGYWIVSSPSLQVNTYPNNMYWNDTAHQQNDQIMGGQPTSDVFQLRTSGTVNASSGEYVAYCWNEIKGYSNIGSYTGNGTTDNAFVYTGFRPAWLFVKKYSASGTGWYFWDNKRNTYNVMLDTFAINTSSAEELNNIEMDFVSNGFKVRSGGSAAGQSTQTFLYMAFAESPFKTARAR